MSRQTAIVLTQHQRSNLLEEEHFGFITQVSLDSGACVEYGKTYDEPFYLRSCAKPLQASILVETDLITKLSDAEIALACGSNAGEKCHYDIATGFAKKFDIKETELKCGIHKPLSKTHQNEMLINGEVETVFHNNCIGKHLTMLALCREFGYPTEFYDDIEHPIQQKILKHVNKLCQVTQNYPITKDGCGVPILSMPLKNIVLGFLNLFCNEKLKKITNAIRQNPYIYGGEDRTDTKILQASNGELLCKVGACGLCVVINPKIKEGFIVKMSDCDMKAREIVTIDFINKLGWAKIPTKKDIYTLHNEKIGYIKTLFD